MPQIHSPLDLRTSCEGVPHLTTEPIDLRVEIQWLSFIVLRAHLGGNRVLGQGDPDVGRECLDHLLRAIAGSFVADDPDAFIAAKMLLEVELVPSPPEERSCV